MVMAENKEIRKLPLTRVQLAYQKLQGQYRPQESNKGIGSESSVKKTRNETIANSFYQSPFRSQYEEGNELV
jgi:hypothetical protein